MYKKCNALTEIWLFVKRHILICILCLLSAMIIAKYSAIPAPEWLPKSFLTLFLRPQEETTASEWWAILNNISLAFIASIITFILIQYIPERTKASKAFFLLKKELVELYSSMSRLIDMYLFEIDVKKSENKITLKQLSSICEVVITNQQKKCKITNLINGKKGNEVSYGYTLYRDSKQIAESIKKHLEQIKGFITVPYLDPDIIEILSKIENNWFLRCFLELKRPQSKTPGYKSIIYSFDKGFYEFIKCHLSFDKYSFDKCSYNYIKISDEEMELEREKMLFTTTRAFFKHRGKERVKSVADQIVALKPTAERIQKSQGILLEILVYYDSELEKQYEVLNDALRIAEYILKNETNKENEQYSLLNYMQVKKRLHTLSHDDIEELYSIISDTNMPDEVVLGASIICGEFEKAALTFEKLSEEKRKTFVQFPIYRLWINPPVEANLDPALFVQF